MRLMVLMAMVLLLTVTKVASTQSQPEKALQDAAAARSKAQAAHDAAAWAKYTTEDFIVIQADGSVKTKAERMAQIRATPPAPVGSNRSTDEKWRIYGATTAVHTLQATAADGRPTRFTHVWVKEQGEWKVASVQLTAIAGVK